MNVTARSVVPSFAKTGKAGAADVVMVDAE
jgi:hypothetical protein